MAPRRSRRVRTVAIQGPSVDPQLEERTNQSEQPNTGQIARWLEQHGVPINSTPQKKPKRTKNPKDSTTQSSKRPINASNVTTMELEAHFKWSFQPSVRNIRQDDELMLGGISEVLEGIEQLSDSGFTSQGEALEGRIGTMISLPSEWIDGSTPLEGGEAYWRDALMMFLKVHDPGQNYVNFLPADEIKAAIYPNPNIFHIHNKNYVGGGIAWTLTNTLASPTFIEQPDTEMKVEHLVSSFLNGFLNVTDCETSSNAQLKFREEIMCLGSYPCPDFVARIKMGILEERLQHDLYPAIFLAEAKRKSISEKTRTIQPDPRLQAPLGKGSSSQHPRTDKVHPNFDPGQFPTAAQMGFAVYPSLVIIIAFLITQWRSIKSKGKKPSPKDYRIPDWAVIYGIGYAGNGVVIYAFFPRVIEWDEDNFPMKWGFMSVIASTAFVNVFNEEERLERFNLIRVLLMLQQHANRLKDRLADLRLPEEFLD